MVLACFVPRAWIAYSWDLVWTDSITYLRAVEAIEHGDLQRAFDEAGLNTYPVILVAFRRLGIDWASGGKWLSVLMATAAVLPLFGWIRRQFDDQVAIVACLAYAVHGKLMAVSVLAIRDATFWFLFTLTLYLLWRAVTEVRLGLFLATGLAWTLAAHTRTEGWLLTIPVGLWSIFRLPAIRGRRLRLVLGTALCMAMVPLSITLVNATWLRHAPRWNPFRTPTSKFLTTGCIPNPPKRLRERLSRRLAASAETPYEDRIALSVETDPMGALPASLSNVVLLRKLGLDDNEGLYVCFGVIGLDWRMAVVAGISAARSSNAPV